MSDKPLTYDCRKCSTKQLALCIDKLPFSHSDKLKVWEVFISGKATAEAQRLLQLRCPLKPEAPEQEEGKKAATSEQSQPTLTELRGGRPDYFFTRPLRIGEKEAMDTKPISTEQPPAHKQDSHQVKPGKEEPQEEWPLAPSYMLVALSTGHRIALPSRGAMTLGRVDFDLGSTPDVDLTHDASGQRSSISRFHAKVFLEKGCYYLEDLGSTNGTTVNGREIKLGVKVSIRPGDRISLGLCEMMCCAAPQRPNRDIGHFVRAYLMVTFNGYRYYLPDKSEVILGRSEPEKGWNVDVDLGQQGKVAGVVSRRHARLTRQAGVDYLQDQGSTYGTKLNGRLVKDDIIPLVPGDHIWLGGCVLCYDHEISGSPVNSGFPPSRP